MANDGRRTRDHGLRRVNRLTSATLVGGLALTGGLSAIAAHAYSGATKSPATSTVDEAAADGVTADGTDVTSAPELTTDAPPTPAVTDTQALPAPVRSRATASPPSQAVPASVTGAAVSVTPAAPIVGAVSTTTRPKTVVTTPRRTRTTKPPVSGGS